MIIYNAFNSALTLLAYTYVVLLNVLLMRDMVYHSLEFWGGTWGRANQILGWLGLRL